MRTLLLNSWPGTAIVGSGLLPDLSARSPITVPTNAWNFDVRPAPKDVDSAAMINTIKGYLSAPDPLNGRLSTDFGVTYGIPYAGVLATTQLATVRIDRSPSQSDPGPGGIWTATGSGWKESLYPIPVEAKTDLNYIEGGPVHIDEGDRHMLLLDVDNWILYEFAYMRWQQVSYYPYDSLPGKWSAGYAAKWDLKTNDQRPDGWTSTDAAGLAVLPGLIRLDELLSDSPIRHSLRFAVPKATATYFSPASHPAHSGSQSDPADPGGMPMGLRLRMKSTIDFAAKGITNQYSLKLFHAMQTYGIILADRCGSHNNMIFQGCLDSRWNNGGLFDIIATDFHKLFVTDFDVIQKGWIPADSKPTREIIMSN